MHKRTKRLILRAALSLLGISLVLCNGIRLFKGVPEWYRRSSISAAQRELLARQALDKFTDIQNAAALARNDEMVAEKNEAASSPASIEVSFSDDELNAFFEKWANYASWKSNYDRYVDNPLIIIQQNHLILAGKVKDLGAIVSMEFEAQIDTDGQLDLHLDRVLAGRLSVPKLLVRGYTNHLTAGLRAKLPQWRQAAAIDLDGAANGDLISASMAMLFMHALDRTDADPVLFLPLVERRANVPVRVCAVTIEGHTVKMTVVPLDAKERAALLKRIRADKSSAP